MRPEIEYAIQVLTARGYTVQPPETKPDPHRVTRQRYKESGETWENNPRAYVEAFQESRGAFSAALDSFELPELVEMMRSWATKTLRDIQTYGSDLAFTKAQRQALTVAAGQILVERYPFVTRTGHGMVEE